MSSLNRDTRRILPILAGDPLEQAEWPLLRLARGLARRREQRGA